MLYVVCYRPLEYMCNYEDMFKFRSSCCFKSSPRIGCQSLMLGSLYVNKRFELHIRLKPPAMEKHLRDSKILAWTVRNIHHYNLIFVF